jgi:glucose-1-phosphate thymidylyltransferase
MKYGIVKGEWTDAGTFESFQYANQLLFSINNRIITGDEDADTL